MPLDQFLPLGIGRQDVSRRETTGIGMHDIVDRLGGDNSHLRIPVVEVRQECHALGPWSSLQAEWPRL